MNSSQQLKRFGLFQQWLAGTELFLLSVMVGSIAGWTSPYLAKLDEIENPDSELPINKVEASWIASLINLSRPGGAISGAIFTHIIGTKLSSLCVGIPVALGWVLFLIKNSVTFVYAARTLGGIGFGMFFSCFPLYIGEISHPKIRGALVALVMQGLMVGNLCGTIMGKFVDMWVYAAIILVPNLIFLVSFGLMPHTPHYLIRCNKMEKAAKSIEFYDRNADVTTQLEDLKEFIQTNQSLTFRDSLRQLNTPVNRKALIMVNIIFAFFQLSGNYTVNAYMEILLTKARINVIVPSTLVISGNVVSILSSWLSIYTNDKYGRPLMLLISSTGVGIAMFLWGLHYQLLDLSFNSPNLQWMSIVALVIYQMSVPVGLLAVPSTLISEMFAPNVKNLSASISSVMSGICAFAASRSYQPMVDVLSEKYVFWIYSLLMFTAGLYSIIFIPETKGKSLAEIQQMLSQGVKVKSNNENKLSNEIKVAEKI
ncbi:facilitated trehalose transporter Tret1-like [Microplitis mediator]|uniref:facilitated trehalose transporter Tret1-like n=1 Tax=Microplitis mediator TaxID=375433 RepID=UPI00255244D9|nr:facilitated trehalose transporter Tret1-like [Microplitis mediator]